MPRDLEADKRLCEEATPGPWEARDALPYWLAEVERLRIEMWGILGALDGILGSSPADEIWPCIKRSELEYIRANVVGAIKGGESDG